MRNRSPKPWHGTMGMRSRSPRRWHGTMGDQASDSFNSQLEFYKNLLVDAFKKRTLAFADRESTRFRFFSVWRAKFESLVGMILAQIYSTNNNDAAQLFLYMINAIKVALPIFAMDGSSVPGYARTGPFYSGGGMNVHLFSPIDQLVTLPFYPPTSPKPHYQTYPGYYSGRDGNVSVQRLLSQYFLILPRAGEPFSVPPSKKWVSTTVGFYTAAKPEWTTNYDYVASLFTQNFGGLNLIDVINEAKDYVASLTVKTMNAIAAQENIDQVKAQAAQFIADYNAHMLVPISLDDLAAQAEHDANNPPIPASVPVTESQAISQTATSNTVVTGGTPSTPVANVVAPPVEAQSKLPLLAALAAGAVMLMRKS